jgi:hypothetical protein
MPSNHASGRLILMKLRFSILSLLVVTLYAAVAVAGVVDPLSVWGFAVVPMWIGAAIWCVHRSTLGPSMQSVFAAAFVITSMAIIATEMLAGMPGHVSNQVLEALGAVDGNERGDIAVRYRELFMAHGGVWASCLGGLVAALFFHTECAREPAA